MEKPLDLSFLKDPKTFYKISYTELNKIVNGNFIKTFRLNNNLSIKRLSIILGVPEKIINKWEQNKKKIKGPSVPLIYLLSKHPDLLSDLYTEEFHLPKEGI